MKEPLIAIIIVNYNGYEDTIECIKSLKDIYYSNYFVVVVDNGSSIKASDQQKDFLINNTIYITLKDNLGFSKGNNVGIKAVCDKNPDYYLLLNNDTVVTAEFLNILVDEAKTDNKIGIVGGKINLYSQKDIIWYGGGLYDYNNGKTVHQQWLIKDKNTSQNHKDVTFITGCMMLISKQNIEDVGLLDESFFLYSEDSEYCCRSLKAGKKLRYCDDALIYHKVSASTNKMNVSSQYYLIRNGLYVAKKYANNFSKALIISMIQSLKDIFKKRIQAKIVIQSYFDFFRGIKGKYPY